MIRRRRVLGPGALVVLATLVGAAVAGAADGPPAGMPVPMPLDAYPASAGEPLFSVLAERVRQDPLNLVATLIFLGALIHTFCTALFRKWAHAAE